MIWLLAEILVFVVAAAVFGGLIGLGLANSGANRRAVAFEREHQGLLDQAQSLKSSQRAVEAEAAARAAAEAAARGDLEARLVEAEAAAADYRARAEAAERRLRVLQSPADSPALIEAVSPALAAPVAGDADAEPGQAAGAAGGDKPPGRAAPDGGKPDDLRRIRGIGPKNEDVLNSLGIYHYDQIAALTPANIAWLEAYLKLHGRIAREDWVGQARALAQGGASTEVHPQDAGA